MVIDRGSFCRPWNFFIASVKFLLLFLGWVGVGGFGGCGDMVGFGVWVFWGLDFLDVGAKPLWVSRVRVSPILMNSWRFLSGWGFLIFGLIFLGF